MIPVLWFHDQIEKLSQPLARDLEQLCATISGGWGVEHGPDGRHVDVTATRVTCTTRVSAPSHHYPPVTYYITGPAGDPSGNAGPHIISSAASLANTSQSVDRAGMIRVLYTTTVTASNVIVGRLSATGRIPGDVVKLVNADLPGGHFLLLELDNTGAIGGRVDGAPFTSTYGGGPTYVQLSPGTYASLLFDISEAGTQPARPVWRVDISSTV